MSFMKDFVKESTGVLGEVTGKRRWYARLIAVGPGSSGYYSREALQTSGPAAFPIGTRVNADHMTEDERWNRPERSIMNVIGAIATTPVLDTVDGIEGLYAEIEFTTEAAPLVEQLGPILGLSIFANYIADESAGEREDGLTTVKAFVPSPLNTVDLVTAPGANGKLLEALESFHDIMNNDGTERTEETMKPEDIEALAEALVPKLKEAMESKKEVEPTDEVKVSDIAEAIISAELPKPARRNIYARVAAGEPVEEAIKTEKAYAEEIMASLKEEVGVFHASESSEQTFDYVPGVWSK